MKSAEKFPEYQGNDKNIQFLSRQEHFAAHNGNYQIFTNGYYDVKTNQTKDFGNGPPEPPKVEKLSNPIIKETASEKQCATSNAQNKINSQTIASETGGGARAPNSKATASDSQTTERGAKPSQEDNHPANKVISSERGQKPSSTENVSQGKGIERGIKPSEGEASIKTAAEAAKIASERAAQNAVLKTTGMACNPI